MPLPGIHHGPGGGGQATGRRRKACNTPVLNPRRSACRRSGDPGTCVPGTAGVRLHLWQQPVHFVPPDRRKGRQAGPQRGTAQPVGHRRQRDTAWPAEAPRLGHYGSRSACLGHELGSQAGLADTGFAGDQQQPRLMVQGKQPACLQLRDFAGAANQFGLPMPCRIPHSRRPRTVGRVNRVSFHPHSRPTGASR